MNILDEENIEKSDIGKSDLPPVPPGSETGLSVFIFVVFFRIFTTYWLHVYRYC